MVVIVSVGDARSSNILQLHLKTVALDAGVIDRIEVVDTALSDAVAGGDAGHRQNAYHKRISHQHRRAERSHNTDWSLGNGWGFHNFCATKTLLNEWTFCKTDHF
jgi:hypothetical protein